MNDANNKKLQKKLEKSTKEFEKSAELINLHFGHVKALFQENIHIDNELHVINKEHPKIDRLKVNKIKGIPYVKYFAILIETILAVRGFEYLFTIVLDLDIPKWSIFLLSFIFSFLIIEGTARILYWLKEINIKEKNKKKDSNQYFATIISITPLLIVPTLNYFTYKFDQTDEKEIFLALALITLMIKMTIRNK